MKTRYREDTHTCTNCRETKSGAFVLTFSDLVLVLCEDCFGKHLRRGEKARRRLAMDRLKRTESTP